MAMQLSLMVYTEFGLIVRVFRELKGKCPLAKSLFGFLLPLPTDFLYPYAAFTPRGSYRLDLKHTDLGRRIYPREV